MNDQNSTPADDNNDGMRATVASYGNAPSPKPQISDDLRPYVSRIAAMDYFEDVPGIGSGGEGIKISAPTVDSLPPEARSAALAQLHGIDPAIRPAKEAELVTSILRAKAYANRGVQGVGADALPYHRAQANIARQVYDIDRQIKFYEGELGAVSGHETVTDPETGKAVPKEIHRVSGERRRGYEANLNDLKRQRRLYVTEDGKLGLQAQREAEEALIESAKMLKARDDARQEEREVKAMAEKINRDERIRTRAEALASMQRNRG